MDKYHFRSPAAIAGGVLAASGAIALLVRDGFTTGWTVDLALMPVLVCLTVLCGHLFWQALAGFRLISAALLAMLALFGSAIVVYETTGRRAETRDTKTAQAEMSHEHRAHTQAMLAEAEENVTRYREQMARHCQTGVGKACKGSEYTVKTWEAAVVGYKAELAGLGAPKPVDARGERVVALAGLLGFAAQPAAIQANVALLEPLAFPLFLELGSIALFGYGMGRGQKKAIVEAPKVAQEALTYEKPLTDDEIEQLRKVLIGIGRPVSNGDLARILGLSASEASKRVTEGVARGLINRQRAGREVAITVH